MSREKAIVLAQKYNLPEMAEAIKRGNNLSPCGVLEKAVERCGVDKVFDVLIKMADVCWIYCLVESVDIVLDDNQIDKAISVFSSSDEPYLFYWICKFVEHAGGLEKRHISNFISILAKRENLPGIYNLCCSNNTLVEEHADELVFVFLNAKNTHYASYYALHLLCYFSGFDNNHVDILITVIEKAKDAGLVYPFNQEHKHSVKVSVKLKEYQKTRILSVFKE